MNSDKIPLQQIRRDTMGPVLVSESIPENAVSRACVRFFDQAYRQDSAHWGRSDNVVIKQHISQGPFWKVHQWHLCFLSVWVCFEFGSDNSSNSNQSLGRISGQRYLEHCGWCLKALTIKMNSFPGCHLIWLRAHPLYECVFQSPLLYIYLEILHTKRTYICMKTWCAFVRSECGYVCVPAS